MEASGRELRSRMPGSGSQKPGAERLEQNAKNRGSGARARNCRLVTGATSCKLLIVGHELRAVSWELMESQGLSAASHKAGTDEEPGVRNY